jgi:hypothetical protein
MGEGRTDEVNWWLFSCLDLIIGVEGCEFFLNSKSVRDPFVSND